MKGEEKSITEMLSKDDGFIIPVYQRDYAWGLEQCKQLYDDLVATVKTNRPSHFFGSIVSALDPKGNKSHYIIIDGQQRITTISILLLAMRNISINGELKSNDTKFVDYINSHLIEHVRDKIKLIPATNSQIAYKALFENDGNYVKDSRVTVNYNYFYDRILRNELTIDELFESIDKLMIIDIFLSSDDDAQLIFESLNSTGLDLSESDKVRNYVLMSLDIDEQEKYYSHYWGKIENNTSGRTDNFIRDYLTIKLKRIPTQSKIYDEFKIYSRNLNKEELLSEMVKYSKYYLSIYSPEKANPEIISNLRLLRKLDFGVANPYLLELLDNYNSQKLSDLDVRKSLEIIEDYLFRRVICGVQTNSLNKVFTTLHKDVIKLDGNDVGYVEKLKYILIHKESGARFPDDNEFSESLHTRNIYTTMAERYKLYLLERLEQYGNDEKIDIRNLISENKLSIEHIMPQTLTEKWIDELGGLEKANEVHEKWLHKLANLSFTAYNSKYSNYPFEEKRDMELGYKDSKFTLNKFVAGCDKWTETELIQRENILTNLSLKIWYPLTSSFEPKIKQIGTVVNLNEDDDFTGKTIDSFKFEGIEYDVGSWKEFLIIMLQLLHKKDKKILTDLVFAPKNNLLGMSFKPTNEEYQWRYSKIDEGVYVYTNSSTTSKIDVLCQCMNKFGIPTTNVEITLSNNRTESSE